MNRMISKTFPLTLATPAYLGDAAQDACWRTPPLKALLRQWWRIAIAAQVDYDHLRIRQREGELFGNAWLDSGASKSLVRLRLDPADDSGAVAWSPGTQHGVAPMPVDINTGYAWFGLDDPKGKTKRKGIKPGVREGQRRLRLAYPAACEDEMLRTIALINAFGSIGSRSRGGWGSIAVGEAGNALPADLKPIARSLPACLALDWAASLVDDDGPWLWETEPLNGSWDKVMKRVAALRRDVRTSLKDLGGRDLRAVLGFAKNGRMPSPLRWKVVGDPAGSHRIRVFAMPHRPPPEVGVRDGQVEQAWRRVRETIDQSSVLQPVAG